MASPTATGPDDVTFLNGVSVDTLVGGAEPGTSDGDAKAARLSNPVSISRADAATFAVADYDSSLLRLVTKEGRTSTIDTTGAFNQPYGLAQVGGTIFVQSDRDSQGAKTSETGTIWSVANPSGPASMFKENIGRPRALVRMNATSLALADVVHDIVQILDTASKQLRVLAGTRDCRGFAEGPGDRTLFNAPAGIVPRSDGSLVVTDSGNRRVRLISPDGTVSTLAGNGTAATVDGPGATASFVRPRALAIDGRDNVYVSDDGAHRIRRIGADGTVITVAGAGSGANGFQDGNGASARFAGQEGLALSEDGKILYVADGNGGTEIADEMEYHRIRRVHLP